MLLSVCCRQQRNWRELMLHKSNRQMLDANHTITGELTLLLGQVGVAAAPYPPSQVEVQAMCVLQSATATATHHADHTPLKSSRPKKLAPCHPATTKQIPSPGRVISDFVPGCTITHHTSGRRGKASTS